MTEPRAEHPERDAFLLLTRVVDELQGQVNALLKKEKLSDAQYNVLRILRGAKMGELSCGEIGERLVKRVPDVTRLIDRMEENGLLARRRAEEDRRVVRVKISARGKRLCEKLVEPLERLHEEQFKALSHRDLASLQRIVGRLDDAAEG